jgi:hypothetical protein
MLAALVTTAVAASSAQAAGNGLFLVGGKEVTAVTPISATTTLDSELLSIGFNLFCDSAAFKGNITSKTLGEGTFVFFDCRVLNGEEVCLIENNGTVESTLLIFETLLLGKIVRFSPAWGKSIVPVDISSHEEACTVIIDPQLETISIESTVCAEVSGDQIKLLLSAVHCLLLVNGNPAEWHGPPMLIQSGATGVTTHA